MALTATDPRPIGGARPRAARRRAARTTARYLAVWLLALAFVFPFLSMLSTAFKLPDDIFSAPPSLWPTEWTLQNFVAVFDEIPFWQYLLNTVVIAGLSVLGMLIASPLVAYSLSKIGWRGQRPLLVIVMATMMLPPQVTMIPLFLMWNGLGATNSIIPLVAPAFFGTPFLIFMLRQFLTSVPNELLQAARIDGASELRIYWSIVLPQARRPSSPPRSSSSCGHGPTSSIRSSISMMRASTHCPSVCTRSSGSGTWSGAR